MVQAVKIGSWIKTDGTIVAVVPRKGKKFGLEELQEMVGGYVERIKLPKRAAMIINEDGISLRLPDNPTASEISGKPIVGNVVVVPSGMGWS